MYLEGLVVQAKYRGATEARKTGFETDGHISACTKLTVYT